MTAQHSDQPVNLKGTEFYPISSIEVLEYHDQEEGQGDPVAVLLWIKVEGAEDTPFAMRFNSGPPVDELIVALMTHRKAVFGSKWDGGRGPGMSPGYRPP